MKLVHDSNIQSQISAFQHVQVSGTLAVNIAINFGSQRHTSKGSMKTPRHLLPILYFGLMGPQFFAFYKH